MPNPNGEAPITLEAMLAEMEALKAAGRTRAQVELSDEQEAVLRAARPGLQGGVPWAEFMERWTAWGAPGCEDTLRRRMRKMGIR